MISACTIVAANYLPFAHVLADSIFAQHPDASLTVLVIDDEARELQLRDARIDWRRLSDIGLDPLEIHRLAGIYDVTELSTAVKPPLLRRLLDEGRSDVIYLDPDIRLYDSLAEVALLARQQGIVLTPHTMEPLPKDGLEIDDRFVLAAGVYNLGFIAVGASSRPFLDWWWQSTRREALIDVKRMMFADQRWIDYAPSLFAPYLLKDPGYNVAYWNLHARQVTEERERYLVDGVPLRFFHFSGFEIRKPWLLSRHQGERPRVLLSERPVLARICEDYAARLRRAGIETAMTRPYGWRAVAAGFELSGRMRRLYWHGVRAAEQGHAPEPADPFDMANPERFPAWLNTPDEQGPRRVSRYLYAIYCDRLDVQREFPDLDGIDAARFADWVWRYGAEQEQIPVELLPPRAADDLAALHVDLDTDTARPTLAEGINFVGHFRAILGIGEAARLLTHAADVAQIPHATITCDDTVHWQDHPFDERPAGAGSYDINILCVNADGTPPFAREAGPAFFAGRHTVGYWFWEVDPLPAGMHHAFDHVDEVWTATEYMAGIIRAAGRKPVFTVPVPVPVPAVSPVITRERLGLPNRFVFLLLFDFLSVVSRKNPLGLIKAFSTAFSPDEGPMLLIKSINGHLRLPELEQLRMAAAARPDITVVDQCYSVEERDALLGACDCYVSLHRSEGLGLTMAEAMALGKPVIATGYSGNLHFMTPDNSYLVDYTLSAVPAGCGPYPVGARWAAPNLDHAARLMREVYERPFDAARKARRGQADILERHGVKVAAAALTRRVDQIRRDRTRISIMVAPPVVAPEVEPPRVMIMPAHEAHEAREDREERERHEPEREEVGREEIARDQIARDQIAPQPTVVASLEALVPLLERLGAPRLSAEGRTWPAMRLAAQRMLFRLIRPYWFQQRQFQDALITALLSSVKTLAEDVTTLRADAETFRTNIGAHSRELAEAKAETRTSIAETHKSIAETHKSIVETKTTIAALSERVFALPYVRGRERFIERTPDGDTRLGYGSANGSHANGGSHAYAGSNGHSGVNGHAHSRVAAHSGSGSRSAEPLFRTRQRLYLPLLTPRAPVLDIGCGRGGMLDLLRVARVPAVGIDPDPEMVGFCRANGHTVEQAEALQFLRAQRDRSVGAIFSARLIEHLSFEQLQEFFRLCRRRLELGGLLIAETANPRGLAALEPLDLLEPRVTPAASTRAISPEVALALCELAGFERAHVLFPTGTGDLDPDRHAQGHYAVVATAAAHD